MEEANASDLYNVAMICRFCGETETLPANAADRVLAVRARLQKIAWARQNADAPALAIAQAIEHYKRMAIPMVLFVVCMPCLMRLPSFLEGPVDGTHALTYAMGPLISVVMMVAVMGGSLAGIVSYRRELRPALLAFPPSVEGAPLRCRVCGGDLPSAPSGAFVKCRYCAAQNLVSADVAQRRAEDLQRELDAHQAQARARMVRYTWMGTVGGGLLVAILLVLGYTLLSSQY